MKRYESLLTSFASRINAIHQSLAGDAALLSSSVESDALAHSVSSRFSASIPSADLLMDVANYNALHRFFHRFVLLHVPSVSNINLLSHTEFVYFCLFFQSSLISFYSIPCFSKLDKIETATEAYKLASSDPTAPVVTLPHHPHFHIVCLGFPHMQQHPRWCLRYLRRCWIFQSRQKQVSLTGSRRNQIQHSQM